MALKRKLDFDAPNDYPQSAKHLKLVPFPGYEPDTDVAMSDSPSSDLDLFFPENHHSRLVSTASTASSSSISSGLLDAVDYSSRKRFVMSVVINSAKVIGLMQPASSFSHHGSHTFQFSDLTARLSHFNKQLDSWTDYHTAIRLFDALQS
ncbi:hypothetical protein ID866_6482 [Astraeus odoratus]|nr:hypothetical protein ID866_6482 [Astraeus odoratus]